MPSLSPVVIASEKEIKGAGYKSLAMRTSALNFSVQHEHLHAHGPTLGISTISK